MFDCREGPEDGRAPNYRSYKVIMFKNCYQDFHNQKYFNNFPGAKAGYKADFYPSCHYVSIAKHI